MPSPHARMTHPTRTSRAMVEPTRDPDRVPPGVVEAVALQECPPGLFWFGNTLGFRSEYACDAYVVESGEYFWGGVSKHAERSALLVTPLPTDRAALAAALVPEGFAVVPMALAKAMWGEIHDARNAAAMAAVREDELNILLRDMEAAGLAKWIPTLEEVQAAYADTSSLPASPEPTP